MKNKKIKVVLGLALVGLMAACGTIDPAKVAKIDPTGKGEFLGIVINQDNTPCDFYGPDSRCSVPGKFKASSVVIANGYWKGMAKVPTLIPVDAEVHAGVSDGDIVRIIVRGTKWGEYVETVAKHGDPTCYWVGSVSLTDGGVECPRLGYTYKNLKSYSTGEFFK